MKDQVPDFMQPWFRYALPRFARSLASEVRSRETERSAALRIQRDDFLIAPYEYR